MYCVIYELLLQFESELVLSWGWHDLLKVLAIGDFDVAIRIQSFEVVVNCCAGEDVSLVREEMLQDIRQFAAGTMDLEYETSTLDAQLHL